MIQTIINNYYTKKSFFMKHTNHFLATILLLAFSVSIISCDPTQKQLAKEKARTEETVKAETEILKSEILGLKNEIKLSKLKSDLALETYKLEALQKPKEFKTQYELSNEMDELNSKIESLNSEIATLESSISSTSTK